MNLISFIQGTVMHKTETSVMVLCGNIGYEVLVPPNRTSQYQIDHEYPFFIATHVREDAIQLYGFDSWNERELFFILQNVSGIGAKSALAIVGQLTFSGLYQAVMQDNIDLLTKVPGIGKKTAQRLVLELKDRLPKTPQTEIIEWTPEEDSGISLEPLVQKDDIYAVLLYLGYKEYEIRNIYGQIKPMIGIEDEQAIIKTALKLLAKV